MQGSFFASITPDPRGPEGRMLVKLGTVKAPVGASHWLLEFQAQGYRFSNVLSADRLGSFAFFNSATERQAFLDELMAQSVTEASPSPDVVPETPAP